MILPPPPTPFVLLDDARLAGAGDARLYAAPERVIVAHHRDDVRPALAALRAGIAEGLDAAGFLAYEAGHALEPRLDALGAQPEGPLLWFGLFRGWQSIPAAEVPELLPDPAGGHVAPARPLISRAAYGTAFAEVQRLIAAGDTYQANLTFQTRMAIAGHPLALYAGLRQRARAGHGGIVFTGDRWLLSLSPELFFTLADGRLTARPMKGTAERGGDPATDAALASELAADPKQRAENLMIVDLLRNDLTRVAAPGSVAVPRLFEVETYPTVHQLTSTVTARLGEGRSAVDVVEAIFPCGSITGAPKIRAMEVIDAVEAAPRGVYTGAIGRIDAAGDASFNVAIRTLCLTGENGGKQGAILGLGSGVVADSDVDLEWREALTKGAFAATPERFDLIETMAFDSAAGIALLDLHLGRLVASATALDFACDAAAIRAAILRTCAGLDAPATIRLKLSRSGALAVERRPMPPAGTEPVMVKLVPLPVDPADFRLRHKTSARGFYDQARTAAGAFEVLFVDPQGFLTEGSFTSLFVERDNRLLTPPLARGLLPGVLRASLIAAGRAVEQDLRSDDLLQGRLLIGNARRGLMRATLAI
ncbi:aminodeoxychorismate synthase component I [Sphingomonas zeicaulis]|uniref:aminodeoxychorismate synthase component I n=1 Tax=Sphingomonas zeicaulis TaxID=1632740 RepID=UPI003D227DFE